MSFRRLKGDTHANRYRRCVAAAESDRVFAHGKHHRCGVLGQPFGLFQRQTIAGHRFVGPEEHVLAGAEFTLPLPPLAANLYERIDESLVVESRSGLGVDLHADSRLRVGYADGPRGVFGLGRLHFVPGLTDKALEILVPLWPNQAILATLVEQFGPILRRFVAGQCRIDA